MISRLFDFAFPVLGIIEPESAHDLTLYALRYGLHPHQCEPDDLRLYQKVWGLTFRNPIGMAAGFDKNGVAVGAFFRMGFGSVEVGTVTPEPQTGNKRPRLFRLKRDLGVINRFGFNNEGHDIVHKRLVAREHRGILGVNIGANKTSKNRIEDYVQGVHAFVDVADYFTVNVSSPNTPGLRDLQSPENLNALMSWLSVARDALMEAGERWRPILIKLSPDIPYDDLKAVVDCLLANDVDGIVISNTTLKRENLQEKNLAEETGGLSGRPLFYRATEMLAKVYLLTEGKIPLIGVGGIDSGDTALAKIQAGASLVQLYTGLTYRGPALIEEIKESLIQEINSKGYSSISDAVGGHAEAWVSGEYRSIHIDKV